MLRFRVCLIFIFAVPYLVWAVPAYATLHHHQPQTASLVMDESNGKILYSRHALALTFPASLTKVMTLYLLFEALHAHKLKMSSPLRVSAHAASQVPTRLGLRPGETISVQDAIYAMITRSANDAAVVVAERLGHTERHFSRMMTRKAHQLGMRRTFFQNASGLPNLRQVTTAHDMAILGMRIQRDFPQYFPYFATRSFVWRGEVILNHNHLLRKYPGTTGLKTGYTDRSGFNLIATVQRDHIKLVGVVLGGKTAQMRDEKMMQLFDIVFARYAAQLKKLPVKPHRRRL